MKKYLAILLVSLGFSSLLLTRQTVHAADNDDAATTNQSAPKYTGLKKMVNIMSILIKQASNVLKIPRLKKHIIGLIKAAR